jgi:hypothetical protein
MKRDEETQAALKAALAENRRLRAEVERLRDEISGRSAQAPGSASSDFGATPCLPSASGIGDIATPADKADKVAFFRSLFRGRDDVYASASA